MRVFEDRNRRLIEIAAIFITAAGKILFMDVLAWRIPFICAVSACWIAYIHFRLRKTPALRYEWGFRFDNFGKAFRVILPFAVLAVAGCFIIGFYQGTINLTWHILPILVLYPLWGTIQQFLVVSLVAGNLSALSRSNSSKAFIIIVTALLFAVVHYPDRWLIAGTFVLALLYVTIFLKERNVFVLGIFHGWLGALFYYTVVGRDPFMEMLQIGSSRLFVN